MTQSHPKHLSEAKRIRQRLLDEPVQSDATILLKVEDLIHMAMGPSELNVVNFKLVQTILFILAREMRMLDQKVEIRVTEAGGAKDQGQESSGGGKDLSTEDDTAEKRSGKKEKSSKGERKAGEKGKESPDRKASKKVEDSSEELSPRKEKKGKEGKSGNKKDEYEDEVKNRDKLKSRDEGKASGKDGRGGKEEDGGKGGKSGEIGDKSGERKVKTGKGGEKDGKRGKREDLDENRDERDRGKSSKGKDVKDKKSRGGIGAEDDLGTKSGGGVSRHGADGAEVGGGGAGGPTGPGGRPLRVGSVEVVSQKQFAVLEAAVKALQDQTSLPPPPTLPDNKQLRADIVKGSASLTDTMQAMQLSARVQAAEKAISTLGDILTQMAAAGALPQEVATKAADIQGNIDAIRQEVEPTGPSAKYSASASSRKSTAGVAPTISQGTRKSVAIDPTISHSRGMQAFADVSTTSQSMRSSRSVGGGGRLSIDSSSRTTGVTHPEMDEALQMLRDDILKIMTGLTQRATTAADIAAATIKGVAEKMNIALTLESRISFLQSLVGDYAEQLNGFGTGLSSQMTGFQEQMAQMRQDLSAGLLQLEQVNNNAETAAVLELTERYEGLVQELDGTLHSHQGLTSYQRELSDELKSLVECVEMMREQKADRDEVLDGLKDKADSSRLAGLVSDEQFQDAREELELRMQMCYDKFRKQDAVWMKVVTDFSDISETKAELMQLLGTRELAQDQLRDLHLKVQQLQQLLGEPKAAILTRKLAKDGTCAVCRVPALMDPTMPAQPASLPAYRPRPTGAAAEDLDEPCLTRAITGEQKTEAEPKPHMCLRWVGGSHTLMAVGAGLGNVSRERATSGLAFERPVKRYLDYGIDGKLYKFEEQLAPCVECNMFSTDKSPEQLEAEVEKIPGEADLPGDGSGDQAVKLVDTSTARVTIVNDNLPAVGDRPRRPTLVDGARKSSHHDGTTVRRATIVEDPIVLGIPSRRGTLADAALLEGDQKLYPSMEKRASLVSKTSIIIAAQEQRPAEVGSVVRGRVTVVDEEAAQRAALLHQIQVDRADQLARAGDDAADNA